LAGYFCKTVTAIINVKGLEFIDYVFTEKMDCFEKMISKIGCRSLADLFSKFLAMYNPEKDEIKENYIEQRKQILEWMLVEYRQNSDFEVQDSIT
jgi:hypothetical protein